MLAHRVHGLSWERAQRRKRTDKKQATISRGRSVLWEPVHGKVSGIGSTSDVDIKLSRVGLWKTSILENRLFKLNGDVGKDDAGVGDDNIDASMRADVNSRLKETDL
jgi:hypothetical protein